MTTMILPWLKFAVCAALIGLAGQVLTRYADTIARLTGLSRTWIGLLLLAIATSVPELFTGISSVAVADAPNIAVGDALGSCVFNLVMLVLLYFVAMRAAFVHERRTRPAPSPTGKEPNITLNVALVRYAAAAVVVAVAGTWLPFVGLEIADAMGWRTTFVGTLFVAGATSLPELVVTISALRIGAVDLAIGNLLGSNLFNMLILAVDDIVYTKGPLFASVSPAHAVTAFAAVVMSGILVVAVQYQPTTRFRGTVGWVSIALTVIYLLSLYSAYLHGH